jgi:hypothetical protein
MTYQFSGGLLLSLLALTVLVALPMKVGARLVHAKYTGLIRCGFAAFVGLLGGFLASVFLGGLIGGFLACALGYVLAIRAMLGTTVLGAIGMTLIAMLVSACGFWVLAHVGWLVPAGATPAVAV